MNKTLFVTFAILAQSFNFIKCRKNGFHDILSSILKEGAKACPPLLGDDPPSGCDKNFVEDVDGDIPCQDDQDCPQSEDWWLDGQSSEGKEIIFGKCEKFRRKRR